MEIIDEAISKVKAVLSSDEMVVSSKVAVDEISERSSVIIKMRIRNFCDSPADLVRIARKIRSLLPRQYSTKFKVEFTI